MRDIQRYAKDYIQSGFENFQVLYRRKKIIEELKKYKHTRILEIGCGLEPLFKYIDNNEYERYVIVEPSVEFYNNACLISNENDKVFCINQCFRYEECLKKERFDYIICSSLLHEIEDPSTLLKDIASICYRETIVHINVPNANSFHRLLAKEIGLIDDVHDLSERNLQYQQHNVFDLTSLKHLVENTGFIVLESGSYFVKPFTHEQMYQMLKEQIINESVLDGLYEMGKYFTDYGSEIYVNVTLR